MVDRDPVERPRPGERRIQGGIFQCEFKSVDQAISDGDYGSWTPSAAERARLIEIFPDGVCDWSQSDVGRPAP